MTDDSTPARLDITGYVVRALALYSLGEFQAGHASSIHVSANGASFTVADDGRGHAIDRNVAGLPYLPFIYTHLDYPFSATASGPIQLQGIGMSLVNALCSELSVTVYRENVTLRMTYNDGRLCDEERKTVANGSSGNTVTGTISPRLQQAGSDPANIEKWLLGVLAVNPPLKVYFNGKELRASPQMPPNPSLNADVPRTFVSPGEPKWRHAGYLDYVSVETQEGGEEKKVHFEGLWNHLQ